MGKLETNSASKNVVDSLQFSFLKLSRVLKTFFSNTNSTN